MKLDGKATLKDIYAEVEEEIIFELRANLRDDLVEEINKNGVKSTILDFTDPDNQQICIKLNEDTYIYSQQNKLFYDYYEDNNTDVKEYYTETINLFIFSSEEIKNGINAFYNSIDKVQEIYGEDYKRILAECIFENNAM